MILSLAIASLILSTFALGLGLWSCIEVASIKKSTHRIDYVPYSASDMGLDDIEAKLSGSAKSDDLYDNLV